jgi:hypothetical protein
MWQLLFYQVAELDDQRSGLTETVRAQAAQDSLMGSCSGAGQVADCLGTAFTQSIEELKARQAEWLEGVTAPGDPGKAAQLRLRLWAATDAIFRTATCKEIVSFRRTCCESPSCPTTRSTTRWSCSSITVMNARLKMKERPSTGARASLWTSKRPASPEDGVKFADPTGACTMMSCGERGWYNGAQFSFKDRQ